MRTREDWAKSLIDCLTANNMAGDNATRFFCEIYSAGDRAGAWERYSGRAEQHSLGNEEILLFPDGSVYVSWQQGSDRIYPDLDMVREQFPEEIDELGLKW